MIINLTQNRVLNEKFAIPRPAVSKYKHWFNQCMNFNNLSFLSVAYFSAWSEWVEVESTERKTIDAKKRSNNEQVTYTCGGCDIIKKRKCPSIRQDDCGENDTIKKNCETRPCPLWSSWSDLHTDKNKNSLCWNDSNNKNHYCYTDTNLRRQGHPDHLGTKTKFRDCQGKMTFEDFQEMKRNSSAFFSSLFSG